MPSTCWSAVNRRAHLAASPCRLRAMIRRPRPPCFGLSTNSGSTALMPEDWTNPGGSSPERPCTAPTMMPRGSVTPWRRPAGSAGRTGGLRSAAEPIICLTAPSDGQEHVAQCFLNLRDGQQEVAVHERVHARSEAGEVALGGIGHDALCTLG